uniref:Mannosyltransferase n=1 Tax=Ditylenchus dipsaci TaxID=166011 RepID=A0A915E6S3_9BILA
MIPAMWRCVLRCAMKLLKIISLADVANAIRLIKVMHPRLPIPSIQGENYERIIEIFLEAQKSPRKRFSRLISLMDELKIIVLNTSDCLFWAIITDCDEVYNYWEPLHLLLFGRGFQTWEYSPAYAIRSWLYINLHNFPAQLMFPLLASSKAAFFHTLRFVIGFVGLSADICLYESVSQRLGNRVALLYMIFNMFSIGMFNASCAFLPSSFSMIMNAFAMAAYLQEKWFWAIFCTCVSALVGWPFAAVLGLPIALEMLVFRAKRLGLRFILFSMASAAIVLPALYFVDSFYYGKPVIAPLNIVLYNIFSDHGPDLYGVEPISYYLKNLFLNWNILPMFALLSLPVSLYVYTRNTYTVVGNQQKDYIQLEYSASYWYRYFPVLTIYLAASLWLLIFFSQPHKEERFLFPIYPLISVLAAIALDSLLRVSNKLHNLVILVVATFILLSLSRGIALHRNFSATLETYKGFHDHFMVKQSQMDFANMQVGKF